MAAKQPKKAPAPAAKKTSAGRARPPKPKAPAVAAVEGMTVTERLAHLEAWALESGAHLPHLIATSDAADAK